LLPGPGAFHQKNTRVGTEVFGGAVTGVCIGIQNHDLLQVILIQEINGSESDIVIDTESFA